MERRGVLSRLKRVYFIGIGGIGMSALARYFLGRGLEVAGYDRHCSELTRALSSEGVEVSYSEGLAHLPLAYRAASADTLVVYTPAISRDDALLRYFQQRGHGLHKRSEVLGWISEEYETYAIAGTHGKTTTSAMLSYVLHSLGGCSAFLGGVSRNLGSNWVGGGEESRLLVVEADEFDRSFLTLRPELPLVTSVAPDHLDYYGTFEALVGAFRQYAMFSRSGKLVCQYGVRDWFADLGLELLTYGVEERDAMYSAWDIHHQGTHSYFTACMPSGERREVELGVPGRHNVENCLAVLAMCSHAGLELSEVTRVLPGFAGVARRFSVMYSGQRVVHIDDYAHHPDEILATLRAVREMFPGRHVTGIFQPHLYSRTRDLLDGFASALSGFDSVLLLPIYAARERPIAGVSSELLLERLPCELPKFSVRPATLMDALGELPYEVVVTLGAGDIGELAFDIAQRLEEQEARHAES